MFQNRKIILCGLLAAILASCSPLKYVPVQEKIIYSYKDSIIIRTDTVRIPIPVEVIKEVVPQLDTLTMETTVAKSVSYLDTISRTLKGTLENKPVELKKEIIYKDKIIQKDTTIYKEIPIETVKEVTKPPKILWYSLAMNILFLIGIALKIYIKIKTGL